MRIGFWKSEEAQATTEYILILSVAVSLILVVFKALKPIFARLVTSTTERFERTLFSKDGMHHLKVAR